MADADPCTSLVLQGPEFSYVFRYEDIQQYPESFIANLVKDWSSNDSTAGGTAAGSTATASHEGSLAGKIRVLQLSDMPESPLTLWPWAAAVAHSIYRYQHITADVLSTLLQGKTGKTYQHFTEPYEQLAKLISYLNLPGQVGDYMPPLHNISLDKSHVLALCFNTTDLALDYKLKCLSEEAVAKMLCYKPFSNDNCHLASKIHMDHGNRFAMFAIALDDQKGLDAPLKVHAVDKAHWVSESMRQAVADCFKPCYKTARLGGQHCPNFNMSCEDAKNIHLVEVLARGQCGAPSQMTAMDTNPFIGNRLNGDADNQKAVEYPRVLLDHINGAFAKSRVGTPLSMFSYCVRYQRRPGSWNYANLPCWVLTW